MTETTKMIKAIANDSKVRIDRIVANYEQLEKENAELKKWQKDTIKARGNDYMDWSRMKDQLTKAKFLLKQLVDAFPKSYSDVVKDTLKQAEQFLSEVEK